MVTIVHCPKCRSTNCFPADVLDIAICIPCGHEFHMLSWWARLLFVLGIARQS